VPRREVWPLLGLGGSIDGVGVVLYLFATFHGLLSLSALLTSFYPAFTVLCARVFLRERLAMLQAFGAVLALAAVALIAAT
jgi:drug/metabolite transporter (DMT)-like permease